MFTKKNLRSPTIAGSVHIKRFFRRRSSRIADLPAKLNSSQLRRLAGGKGLRWWLLPTAYDLICRNNTPGSTGGCVAGSSVAYEYQALTTSCLQVYKSVENYSRSTVNHDYSFALHHKLPRSGIYLPLYTSTTHKTFFLSFFF